MVLMAPGSNSAYRNHTDFNVTNGRMDNESYEDKNLPTRGQLMTLTVIWESPGHVLDPASGATKYIFSDPSQADNPEIPPIRTGGAPQWGIGDGQIWLGGNMATVQLSGSQLFWHCVKDIVKNTSDEYWRVAITCRWLAFGQDIFR